MKLFCSDEIKKEVEEWSKFFLTEKINNFIHPEAINDPRSVGSAVQSLISEKFLEQFSKQIKSYSVSKSRKSIDDFRFDDHIDVSYIVDVKTHSIETKFNMPNITSVERLSELYQNNNHIFMILMNKYKIVDNSIVFVDSLFSPIEDFDWDCLGIAALGIGQIQIKNANKISINLNYDRKQWLIQFYKRLQAFYEKEKVKIDGRIEHFDKIYQKLLQR